jgi:quercetin dioxygenase-like cupin family protein
MVGFEQLNVYGLANLQSKTLQHVHLFARDELKAELILLPPGAEETWHSHEDSDELFDVLAGEGTFWVEEKEFQGGPGKSVYVKAGVRHRLTNDGDRAWLVRSTQHQRLSPRHFGVLLKRAIRARLGLD